MKRIFIALIAGVVLLPACKDEKAVTPGDLPAESSQFIDKHFSGSQINHVVKDNEGLTSAYKVLATMHYLSRKAGGQPTQIAALQTRARNRFYRHSRIAMRR